MRGPIDYIVVGFNDAKFDGSVLKVLTEAIDGGIISLVSLALVKKDADGGVSLVNVEEVGDEYVVEFVKQYGANTQPASQEDVDEVGEMLEAEEAAGLLVIEQLWAKPLKQAILDAGGFLVAEGRIHPEAAFELAEK